ncbi:MAG: TIR domain-containing protein [Emcibacteraceae bacterium]|nr:TIR domain-containing protein [Emcibacteraceae bacterium]
MVKKKIFISFDFASDRALKNEIVAQSQNDGANFKIANWSMKPDTANAKWLKEAKFHITRCDILVVLVGDNTNGSVGVRKEIEIAAQTKTKIIQLLAHPQNTQIEGAGKAHDWTFETLNELLS